MAGVQETTSCTYHCRYHAFLSFRGEDTRKCFSDHLYRALELAGIHTFRDDDEIERGANIAAELHKAIQESRAAIIVFSNDYATSSWCLDELVKIMERRRTDGYMVVPIFYKVDPSVVRWQMGSFAEVFAKHEKQFKEEMGKVDEWRKVLKEVANLGGMVLGDQYESQFIQKIVDEIERKMDPVTLNVAPYAVGINARVEDLNIWLRDGSVEVGVAGIYGMGGIGKTTIAKAAYNMNQDRFEGRSFVADVRATTEQPNGLVRLQRKLISDIQRRKTEKITSVDEGTSKIKNVVCCKRVLIVLDDVNDLDQFNAILGMRKWFHPGSKIIITTRDKHLLKANGVSNIFMVQELDEHESLQLFSWHAFREAHPIEGYKEVSALVVKHCEGLPLALQVLGSFLFGKSVQVWYSTKEKLEEVPHGKIQRVLRISYDYLEDHDDKALFLHLACFFIGKKRNLTFTVLDSLNLYTATGVQNLVDRCLLQVNDDKLMMHQLIRDMGRGIVREESVDDPGKRSRVVQKDAYDILKNASGTETVKGLLLNLSMLMDGMFSKEILKDSNKRWHAEGSDGNCSRRRRLSLFSWKSINSPTNLASTSSVTDFKTEAFKTMPKLQLLLLNNVKVSGGYGEFPKTLIWLSWQGFPMKSIPADFCLRNLVVLELKHSILEFVWKGTKFFPGLKILDLSHSHDLIRTPDLSGLPNLERLILKDCINIVVVDESIGELKKLVFLNLKDCKNLMKLPRRISMLRSLHELILSGCSKLGDTEKFGALSNKTWLSICSWVSPIRKSLEATSSFSLAHLPRSLGSLYLSGCNLSKICDDLSVLSSLKNLDISDNPILSLPESIKSLTKLVTLFLGDCTELKMLPELPPGLSTLHAEGCTSLKKLTNLPNFFMSVNPYLSDCENLSEVQSLFIIKPLRRIDIQMIKNMGLYNLDSMESIEVEISNHLTDTNTTGTL